MRQQISIDRLRDIIREELQAQSIVSSDDVALAQERKDIIDVASKLMKSINEFREKSNESMKSHLSTALDDVYAQLKEMTQSPDAYSDVHTMSPARVVRKTFKPESDLVK